jgi:UTP--glucose-1-phosphate uridylyltransferase
MNNNPQQNEPRYLIIPAAGLGKRMRTVNPDLPKELLPVGHKPAIQYAVEEGLSAGIQKIVIVISRQKEIIRQYFEDPEFSRKIYPRASEELENINKRCSFSFLYQKKPLGESDAVSYAKDIACSHPVVIFHPDDIYFPSPGVLKTLKSVYCRYSTDVIALIDIKEENAAGFSNSGIVDVKPLNDHIYRIEKFHQKGGGHFVPRFKRELRSCGISISGPHIFEYIERLRDTIKDREFTDFPVHALTLEERGFLGCRFQGTFFDIGNPEGYELCLAYIKENEIFRE